MKNRPNVFVSTYEEGVEKVLQGNYAFLMESTMLDYKVQRDCNLTAVGGLLDNKGYGIGTPIGSPWRDKLSLAILDLQEKGELFRHQQIPQLPMGSLPISSGEAFRERRHCVRASSSPSSFPALRWPGDSLRIGTQRCDRFRVNFAILRHFHTTFPRERDVVGSRNHSQTVWT